MFHVEHRTPTSAFVLPLNPQQGRFGYSPSQHVGVRAAPAPPWPLLCSIDRACRSFTPEDAYAACDSSSGQSAPGVHGKLILPMVEAYRYRQKRRGAPANRAFSRQGSALYAALQRCRLLRPPPMRGPASAKCRASSFFVRTKARTCGDYRLGVVGKVGQPPRFCPKG